MIWRYDETSHACPTGELGECIYCKKSLHDMPLRTGRESESIVESYATLRGPHDGRSDASLMVCPICGWWSLSKHKDYHFGPDPVIALHRVVGTLKNLDLTNISTPVEEVTRYLLAKYSDRYKVHPRIFEEVVASVFRDVGYHVRLTSYSGDDGIDVVILDGDQGDVVGVQVKRYRDKIEACQIREFAGSLVLNDLTKGVYVTTSSYSKGAEQTAGKLGEHSILIDLWDAERFYSALSISRCPSYDDPYDPATPFNKFLQDLSTIPLVWEKVLSSGW